MFARQRHSMVESTSKALQGGLGPGQAASPSLAGADKFFAFSSQRSLNGATGPCVVWT